MKVGEGEVTLEEEVDIAEGVGTAVKLDKAEDSDAEEKGLGEGYGGDIEV